MALSDDFNTPRALNEMLSLVGASQTYMSNKGSTRSGLQLELLLKCSEYISDTLDIFGLSSFSSSTRECLNNKAAMMIVS